MSKRFLLTFAVVLAFALSAFAADEYNIDPVHSSANFSVTHMLISTVHGRFDKVTGTITYDPNDPSKCSVTAVIPVSSIDTDSQMRDNDLRSARFFEVDKYPDIRFQSASVRKVGDDKYIATGSLTMKDSTRQIELPFTVHTAVIHGQKKMGVEVEPIVLNRYDYNLSFDPTGATVGKDVTVQISLEADAAPPAKK